VRRGRRPRSGGRPRGQSDRRRPRRTRVAVLRARRGRPARPAPYLRLGDLTDRVLAVDPRTGTTTLDLWPLEGRPDVEEIHDVDDWLAVIATGRCVGVTAESTLSQYRRDGVVFRRVRDAPPVPVRLVWWRDDPHPATRDVVGLLVELYGRGRAPVVQ
jgi:hypothetical protein